LELLGSGVDTVVFKGLPTETVLHRLQSVSKGKFFVRNYPDGAYQLRRAVDTGGSSSRYDELNLTIETSYNRLGVNKLRDIYKKIYPAYSGKFSIRRLDYYYDFAENLSEWAVYNGLRRARKKILYPGTQGVFWQGAKNSLRIYNKTLELKQKKLPAVSGVYDGIKTDVWRIEFQCRYSDSEGATYKERYLDLVYENLLSWNSPKISLKQDKSLLGALLLILGDRITQADLERAVRLTANPARSRKIVQKHRPEYDFKELPAKIMLENLDNDLHLSDRSALYAKFKQSRVRKSFRKADFVTDS
jgi:hypothetical protein